MPNLKEDGNEFTLKNVEFSILQIHDFLGPAVLV